MEKIARTAFETSFEVVNAKGKNRVFLLCDHATHNVPAELDALGLSEAQLNQHIGWDIGAAKVARRLADYLDSPLVLTTYSRLVIDCNRPLNSPDLIPKQSAGIIIPGNAHITAAERDTRIEQIFKPYHQTIELLLNNRITVEHQNHANVLLSIHSFTPFLLNEMRPWHIGVSHKNNARFATHLFTHLSEHCDFPIGFNQPYSIEDAFDYSIPVHGDARGIDSAMIEIRQDQLQTMKNIDFFAKLIAKCCENFITTK